MLLAARNILSEAKPRHRLAANSRALLIVLWLVSVGPEVRGHVGGGQLANAASSTGPVRTVMDLMEVMLNQDILDMLANGGFDFRQPARIFLPPKFYSSVPLDRGPMSPEEILSALATPLQSYQLPSTGAESVASISSPSSLSQRSSTSSVASVGGNPRIDHRQATVGVADFGFGGKEQVVVLDAPDGSRINLISYSDGKVTSSSASGGSGAGAGKGRDTLEKPVGSRAKPNQQRQPVTSSITDQTVSPNVVRTLPTAERRSFALNGRSSASGSATGEGRGSSTDRLRSALPGEPDVDYPIFGSVPATTFSCDKRHHGYYADVEARCQVFRVCANTDSTGRGFAFLCPNGTLFNQRHLVCDWYMNVRCTESENFYHVNEEIGRMVAGDGRPMVSDNRQEMMEVVMSMVMYPMRSLMDQMDGVGVLEERFGSAKDVRPVLPAVPKVPVAPETTTRAGLPVRPSTYLTPVRTELEPPRTEVRAPVPVNNYAPAGRPTLSPNKQSEPTREYAPRVDDVYVSSLGTLSTDPDSGFDPVRSTLLTRTGGSVTGTAAKGTFPAPGFTGFQQTNQIAGKKPSVVSKTGPSDIQLFKADLVKTWNGPDRLSAPQTKPLKLAPVPPSPAPSVFQRAEPQPFVERFSQTTSRRDPELLPPTGVLPPTSFIRTVPVGKQQYDSRLQTGYPEHRFTPARKVLSVQKVTVQPEYPYRTSSGSVAIQGTPTQSGYPVQRPHEDHVSTGNLYHTQGVSSVVTSVPAAQETYVQQPAYVPQQYYYQTASNPVVTGSTQEGYAYPAYYYHTNGASISHRYETGAPVVQQVLAQVYPQSFPGANSRSSFVTSPALLRRNDGPQPGLFKRKKTVLVQVVPSVSFYLNDAEEKRAYDAAVRRGLLDDRRRSTLTSYEVPQGSVGQLTF